MAHTKAQGSVAGNRDSRPKYLGVKLYGGQPVNTGNIIIRQRGATFHAGDGVDMGHDFTIFAVRNGVVNFKKKNGKQVVEVVHE